MACIKLDILDRSYSRLKVVYRKAELSEKGVQRFLRLDPKSRKYPGLTPYNFVGNMPIQAIDPDGRDIIIIGNKAYRQAVRQMLFDLSTTEEGYKQLTKVLTSDHVFVIQNKRGENEVGFDGRIAGSNNAIFTFDLDLESFKRKNEEIGGNLTTGMAHELRHFTIQLEDGLRTFPDIPYENSSYVDDEGNDKVRTRIFEADEIDAVYTENIVRATLGLDLRQEYGNRQVFGQRVSKKLRKFSNNGLVSERPFSTLEKDPNFKFNAKSHLGKYTPESFILLMKQQIDKVRTRVQGDFQSLTKDKDKGYIYPDAERISLPKEYKN